MRVKLEHISNSRLVTAKRRLYYGKGVWRQVTVHYYAMGKRK